jgi:hypothetical protein
MLDDGFINFLVEVVRFFVHFLQVQEIIICNENF